ncbi:MAG: TetR/AcrR family transcriptional regulator [Alphaproteobacteria bacterium]|nr:TetR/AcrR family transcriptional regulator [Alphaproteobacteria bacterium]
MTDRLSKADWIAHGLRVLARDGANALKVGPLAQGLNVSRGSFYWHFRDIADFQAQLLQSWQESSTDQVIQSLDARKGEPGLLRELMQSALSSGRRLDRAMRSWAAEDRAVAAIVASVDAKRVSRVAALLIDAGVAAEHATHRACFLYWAFLGQVAVMDRRYASLPAAALDRITALFEA